MVTFSFLDKGEGTGGGTRNCPGRRRYFVYIGLFSVFFKGGCLVHCWLFCSRSFRAGIAALQQYRHEMLHFVLNDTLLV